MPYPPRWKTALLANAVKEGTKMKSQVVANDFGQEAQEAVFILRRFFCSIKITTITLIF